MGPQTTPQALEAEQSVLGGLLIDNNAYDRLGELSESDFYRDDHRTIFSVIKTILEAGKPCDTLLLGEALKARGVLEQVGGHAYLGALFVNTPSAANIRNYASLVHRAAQGRALQALAADLNAAASAQGADPIKVAEVAADQALSILDDSGKSELQHFSEAVGNAVEWLDAPAKGLSTSYSSLDEIVGGLRPGELIVVAGRPSMGKSSLALCIAEHVSEEHHVVLFSLEMSARQIAARSVRWHEHLSDRSQAVTRLINHNLWIDDSPRLTVGTMRVRMQRIKRKHGLALVVVDYLQMISGGEGENRTQQVGDISRGLKALAKEFQIPVIAVASLNRGVEIRHDKRPMMSDLRESGDIESDADVCVMLYRDEYYDHESYARGFAEAIVRKHRDGPTGTAWLLFQPEYARFRDFTGEPPRAPVAKAAPVTGTVRSMDFKVRAAGDASA